MVRRWVKFLGTVSAWAVSLAACFGTGTASAQDPAVSVVADQRLLIKGAVGSGLLPIYVSRDWGRPQPTVTRAVITIHGLSRNVESYHVSAQKALAASALDPGSVLLIEPQFLSDEDIAVHHLPSETLYWAGADWEGGDDSLGPVALSSFAALDAILSRLADRAKFPALTSVVIAGHSGGGQLVQRYAVAGRGDTALMAAGVHVRYVVANPSSYVYFSPDRPTGDLSHVVHPETCRGYDRWKYGMVAPPPYLAGQDPAALEAAYVRRDVIYLLGTADTDPAHPALDRSCMAEVQGPHRLARGTAYFDYLQRRHSTGLTHRLWQVPGVGHSGRKMLGSACGVAAVYDVPGCSEN